MKKSVAIVIFFVFVAVTGLVVHRRIETRSVATGTARVAVRQVRIATVERGTVSHRIRTSGTVESRQSVEVTPEVAATLLELRVAEGDVVRKGDILARLDASQFATQVAQMEAAVSVAAAGLEAIRHQLANAAADLERIKALYEAGAESRHRLDQIATHHRTLQAQETLASAQVRQAEAGLAQARVLLGKTTITSPLTGVVTRQCLDEGNLARPGMPILSLAELSPIRIVIFLPARALARVRTGDTVGFRTSVYPETRL